MGKTAELRRLIAEKLNTLEGDTYYRKAKNDAEFPYKVFDISRFDFGYSTRDDLDLCVDIWDFGTDTKRIDDMADRIEIMFNAENIPQPTILPTFFRTNRYPVTDPDKDIQHLQMHFLIELYTVGTED